MNRHDLVPILGLLLLAGCHSTPNPVPAAVWTYLDLAPLPARAELFAFASGNQVGDLYLGASGLLPRGAEPLAAFLQESHDRSLRVSLVLGRKEWTLPGRRAEAMPAVRAVVAFARAQREAGAGTRVALHLDVEPQALPNWGQDWVELSHQFLDLLEAVKVELNGELPLLVDIPVWWDRRKLERRGRTRPLCAWVMELADQTVLMDYRNETKEILASAEGNLRIAAALGRTVVLGMDVHCGSDAETLATSFCRKGQGALRQAMADVDHALAGRPGYGGLAVFTYEDWRTLRP